MMVVLSGTEVVRAMGCHRARLKEGGDRTVMQLYYGSTMIVQHWRCKDESDLPVTYR